MYNYCKQSKSSNEETLHVDSFRTAKYDTVKFYDRVEFDQSIEVNKCIYAKKIIPPCITSPLVIEGSLGIEKNLKILGEQEVLCNSYFKNNIIVCNRTTTRELVVQGTASFEGSIEACSGPLSVGTISSCPGNTATTFTENVIIEGGITVEGPASFEGTVAVCPGPLRVSTVTPCPGETATTFTENVIIEGTVDFNAAVDICPGPLSVSTVTPCPGDNTTTFTENVVINGAQTVQGSADFNGPVDICPGPLFVSTVNPCPGDNTTTFTENVVINGAQTVQGTVDFGAAVDACPGPLSVSTISPCPGNTATTFTGSIIVNEEITGERDLFICTGPGAIHTNVLRACFGSNVVTFPNSIQVDGDANFDASVNACPGPLSVNTIIPCTPGGTINFPDGTVNINDLVVNNSFNVTPNSPINFCPAGTLNVDNIQSCSGGPINFPAGATTPGPVSFCPGPLSATNINPCPGDPGIIVGGDITSTGTVSGNTGNFQHYNLSNVNVGVGSSILGPSVGPLGNIREFRTITGTGLSTVNVVGETIQVDTTFTNENVGVLGPHLAPPPGSVTYGDVAGPELSGPTPDFRRFVTDDNDSGRFLTVGTNVVYQFFSFRALANLAGTTQVIPSGVFTKVLFQNTSGNAFTGIDGNPLVTSNLPTGIQRTDPAAEFNLNIGRIYYRGAVRWENNPNGIRIVVLGANIDPGAPVGTVDSAGSSTHEISGLALNQATQISSGPASQKTAWYDIGNAGYPNGATFGMWVYQNSGVPLEIGSAQPNTVSLNLSWRLI